MKVQEAVDLAADIQPYDPDWSYRPLYRNDEQCSVGVWSVPTDAYNRLLGESPELLSEQFQGFL